MRLVYLDEAGISRDNPTLTVAGVLIHGDKQSHQVEGDINALIEKYIPEPDRLGFVFHATDMELYRTLKDVAPELVNPAVTAMWEKRLDAVVRGHQLATAVVNDIASEVHRLIALLKFQNGKVTINVSAAADCGDGRYPG